MGGSALAVYFALSPSKGLMTSAADGTALSWGAQDELKGGERVPTNFVCVRRPFFS